ncbi:mirror-image polydactyly gene 1 protein-like [Dysidea avara]|uniref:mirror-image polydactyly gene 1 protein-like n=1 Tax=Dysidea avara TaxID=196820 RepID=UPI003318945F
METINVDVEELHQSLRKAIEQSSLATEDLKRQLEERQTEIRQRIAQNKIVEEERNEVAKDVHQIQTEVHQLIEENNLLKKQQRPLSLTQHQCVDGKSPAENADLQAAESRNAQLSKRLAKAEAELQALRMAQLRLENTAATKTATQNASLIEKLYSAQKDRDKAVTFKVKTIEEEKLLATKRLNALEKQLQKERAELNRGKPGSDVSQNVEKLLPSLLHDLGEAKGAEQVEQKGQALLEHIQEWQQLHNFPNNTAQLQAEIDRLKKQQQLTAVEHKLVNSAQYKALQDQLIAVSHEKEKISRQLEELESEYEDMRILYSLQRQLTQEGKIHKQYQEKVDRYQKKMDSTTNQLAEMKSHLNVSIKERNTAIQERNQLAQDLLTEQERSEKLDRIVMVLRRKVQTSSADSTPTHI